MKKKYYLIKKTIIFLIIITIFIFLNPKIGYCDSEKLVFLKQDIKYELEKTEQDKMELLSKEYFIKHSNSSIQVMKTSNFDAEKYRPTNTTKVQGATRLKEIANVIVGTANVVATVISVVMFAILGIKYMFGSIEEKVQYKKSLVPYLIGAILVFGITRIIDILSKISGAI